MEDVCHRHGGLSASLSRCRALGVRLDPPDIDKRMTEADWELFTLHWQEFKARNGLEGEEALSQLVRCARGVLSRRLARRCRSEEELLARLKERAVQVNISFTTKEIFIDEELKRNLVERCLVHWDESKRNSRTEFNELRLCVSLQRTHWEYLSQFGGEFRGDILAFAEELCSDEKLAVLVRSLKKTPTECLEEYLRWRCVAPRAGAIILSRDLKRTLLVKGRSRYWSFPKGKQERHLDESSSETACREVEEETGLDIKEKIDVNNYLVKASTEQVVSKLMCYIQENAGRFYTKLFIVQVDESSVRWMDVSSLLESKSSVEFKFVAPFLTGLENRVKELKSLSGPSKVPYEDRRFKSSKESERRRSRFRPYRESHRGL